MNVLTDQSVDSQRSVDTLQESQTSVAKSVPEELEIEENEDDDIDEIFKYVCPRISSNV